MKILIANRGEIALRIIRTAKEMMIPIVAIFSPSDKNSYYVQQADESYLLDATDELSKTYLNISRIIEIALQTNCTAIHAGYGFLSENSDFVNACEKANLTFIGPKNSVMELMGNKVKARKFVNELGLPITKGLVGTKQELLKSDVPFPVLVKAAAGGGGKGMRIVHCQNELEEAIDTTSREALSYFGDGQVYIEQYIAKPRHIEVQILADNFENVIHLFERECTIQRRYQKIIEESPSITLTDEVRENICQCAVDIAKAVNYTSAGTIEFLVDESLNFYFLEMNTRIQVEHPVTEMITGVDIVKEQILVANNKTLSHRQNDIVQNGHAIECRIYAENPLDNFKPTPGEIFTHQQPKGSKIRVETSIYQRATIHSFFDPMISKLIVWDENRNLAIAKMNKALQQYYIHGIVTNISYLKTILNHKSYQNNTIYTKFCEDSSKELIAFCEKERQEISLEMIAKMYVCWDLEATKNPKNVWEEIGYWRNEGKIKAEIEGQSFAFSVKTHGEDFIVDHETIKTIQKNEHGLQVYIGNQIASFFMSEYQGKGYVSYQGEVFEVFRKDVLQTQEFFKAQQNVEYMHQLLAPMPGKLIQICVKEGDQVKAGQKLVILESMKMENALVSPKDAIIEKICVKEGDQVSTDKELLHFQK